MDSFFNPTDKAAIDSFLRNVDGLKDDWWIGEDGLSYKIIVKDSTDTKEINWNHAAREVEKNSS